MNIVSRKIFNSITKVTTDLVKTVVGGSSLFQLVLTSSEFVLVSSVGPLESLQLVALGVIIHQLTASLLNLFLVDGRKDQINLCTQTLDCSSHALCKWPVMYLVWNQRFAITRIPKYSDRISNSFLPSVQGIVFGRQ